MKVPDEAEYARMLGRLQDVMAFAAEELETLADLSGDNVGTRLRNLARVMFRIGNDEDDPVPVDLPSISDPQPPNLHPDQ